MIGVNILPLMLVVFLLPQSFYVTIVYKDTIALQLLIIVLIAVFSYYLTIIAAANLVPKISLSKSKTNIRICKFIVLSFISVNVLLFVIYGSIPWYKSITTGLSPSAVRHDFGQHFEGGPFELLIYVRSIFLRGILPIAIVYLARFESERSVIIMLFSLSLVLISIFEKANLLWVYLPVVFYFLFNKQWKSVIRLLSLLLFFFFLVTIKSVSSFVHIDIDSKSHADDATVYAYNETCSRKVHVEIGTNTLYINSDLSSLNSANKYPNHTDFLIAGLSGFQGDYRFVLGNSNAIQYMLNRAFWIPFVTTYDTILYWEQNYDSEIGFAINRHLSRLSRDTFSDIEREVHRFQYGGNFDSTGNANAAYLAEAYIGFSYFGVIFFSFLIGLIYTIFINGRSVEGNLALISISFGLVNASFVSMLFSGGIAFALFFFLILHVVGSMRVN